MAIGASLLHPKVMIEVPVDIIEALATAMDTHMRGGETKGRDCIKNV